MSTVLVLIVNWRTAETTLKATEAALAAMEGVDGSITIIDNASGDGSFQTLSDSVRKRGWTRGPVRVQVVQTGRNGGFGAGNNYGIRAGLPGGARPDFVHILHSDTLLDPGAIRALVTHMETHPETGLAASAVRGADDRAEVSAFVMPTVATEYRAARGATPFAALPDAQGGGPVDWAPAISLMLREAMLRSIGLFDETFFLFYEDADFSRRAIKAGWATDLVTQSTAVHLDALSSGRKTWGRVPTYWLDSRLHFFIKNHGRVYAGLATLAYLAGAVLSGRRAARPRGFVRDMSVHFLAKIRHMPEPSTLHLNPVAGKGEEPKGRQG